MKKIVIMSLFLIVLGNCLPAETKLPTEEVIKITSDMSSGLVSFQPQTVTIDSIRIQRSKNGDVVFQTDVKNNLANIMPFLQEKNKENKLSNCYYIVIVTVQKGELLRKLFLY